MAIVYTGGTTGGGGGGGGGGFLAYGTQGSTKSTTGTTFPTGVDLLASAISFTADGSSNYVVRVTVPSAQLANLRLNLDSASGDLMCFCPVTGSSGVGPVPVAGVAVISPAAGVHTVNVRLYATSGTAKAFANPDLGPSTMLVTVELL